MSSQTFNAVFREALWEAHNRKCIHCNREILYADLRVDHLLPEYLAVAHVERAEVFNLVGLPSDFEILGRLNLAPSCAHCNDTKGSTILEPGIIAILVSRIRDRIPEVERREADRKAAKELDSILRAVARGVENGSFTVDDLKTKLDDVPQPKELRIELATTINLEEPSEVDKRTLILSRQAVERMRRRRVTLPEVVAEIRRALVDPSTKVDRRTRSGFLIRGSEGLSVNFELWRDKIYVMSAHIS